jgi:hypothetical protein
MATSRGDRGKFSKARSQNGQPRRSDPRRDTVHQEIEHQANKKQSLSEVEEDMANMVLEFDPETSESIRKMAAKLGEPDEEVVRDALNTYRWLMLRQQDGYKVVVYKGTYEEPQDPQLLENLFQRKAA